MTSLPGPRFDLSGLRLISGAGLTSGDKGLRAPIGVLRNGR